MTSPAASLSLLALAFAGCATTDDASNDDDVGTFDDFEDWPDQTAALQLACNDQLPAIDPDAPIFVSYGAYRPSSNLPARVDAPQTLAIAAPGERVITLRRPAVGCVPMVAELAAWRAGGGLVAHTMTIEELGKHLVAGTAADHLETLLRAGYAYVAIDELALPNTAWRNGGSRVGPFRDLLTTLAARGLDRRIIFLVNSYNMVGNLGLYSDVLAALRDHARIVGSEIYLTSRDITAPVVQTNGRCNRSLACFESIATEMRTAAPNINHRTITVLGVSDEYNQGAADALCDAPGGGAGMLFRQYAKLHQGTLTHLQPGVGAYTPVRIQRSEHPAWGANEHVACKNRLDSWASWPRAH